MPPNKSWEIFFEKKGGFIEVESKKLSRIKEKYSE